MVATDMNCFVIAEAGVNHNGSLEMALELVDVAAQAGADAVKFQSFSADKLVVKGAEKAEYQKRETGSDDQHSMLLQLEMSEAMHLRIARHCRDIGIEFMSTPFDKEAATLLVSLGMHRIKVSSAEITNHPFLQHLAAFDLPIILSTGMATLDEVVDAVGAVRAVRQSNNFAKPLEEMLSVLHCTSNYPTKLRDVNLRAMLTMRDVTGIPVGYSDHTAGIVVAVAAVAMGATIIEKHFTLDRSLPGPDHKASLEVSELEDMIKQIRAVEAALGSAEKAPTSDEIAVREVVRRSIVLMRDIPSGDTITEEDVTFLRPGTGIQPKDLPKVLGMKLKCALSADSILQWSDLA